MGGEKTLLILNHIASLPVDTPVIYEEIAKTLGVNASLVSDVSYAMLCFDNSTQITVPKDCLNCKRWNGLSKNGHRKTICPKVKV